jgi:hypothetical protein
MSKSMFLRATIDSIASHRSCISKGHKRSVTLHKAHKWCLTDKQKELVKFMKNNNKVYKRRKSK